jgi:lincosamide nucleotidyltransferase A/C/D/E
MSEHGAMTGHLMTAESAVQLLGALSAHSVEPCVGGGWAVDALVGRQTREHSDLDLWVPASQAESLFVALASLGVDRVFPWPGDRPWNFVVHDGHHRRIDLHFHERADPETLHYGAFDGGHFFPAAALDGHGLIGTTDVRCEHPEWSVRWHTGYPARAVDHHDVPLLCERFGLELPEAFRTAPADGLLNEHRRF